jgi:hypothetical protein
MLGFLPEGWAKGLNLSSVIGLFLGGEMCGKLTREAGFGVFSGLFDLGFHVFGNSCC